MVKIKSAGKSAQVKPTQVFTQVQLVVTSSTTYCESVWHGLYYSTLGSVFVLVEDSCTALLSANSRKVSGKFPIVIVQSEEISKETSLWHTMLLGKPFF